MAPAPLLAGMPIWRLLEWKLQKSHSKHTTNTARWIIKFKLNGL